MGNNEHYFLHCKLFIDQRNVMLNNIRDLGLDISINNILYGIQILNMMSTAQYQYQCPLQYNAIFLK